jgi:transcriptional regulator of acetoin/glycerol metabolism
MKEIWKRFVTTGEFAAGEIRPAILESWQRCRDKNIYPFHKVCPEVLCGEELERRIRENMDLLEIAKPMVKNLCRFVAGTGFVVMICDRYGYVLEIVGDEDNLATLEKANFRKGSCCSEDVLGTNAIGTCLVLGQPIQIYSYEHWSSCVHIGSCSSAPIRDPLNGDIIGALDMTGPWDKVHPHTLGMVVASAGAVESLMESRANYRKAILADQNKALILDSTTAGLITIDNKGIINHINGHAMKYLALNENPTGQYIYAVFKSNPNRREIYKEFLWWAESKEKISDEFLTIHHESGPLRCLGSAHSVLENGRPIGRLIILQDISRINRLVKKVVSKQATTTFENLVSKNRMVLENIDTAFNAARTDTNILILGESGTGKELFAQAIHNASQRSNKPFIAINCGAIPKDLLSSELFGYVSGAFTGAQKGGAAGKFEMANGGTVFLDEIGDMPLDMQAALLRVIQERVIMRVGSSNAIPVDVRIIAATNKDLVAEIGSRNFRSDLYYRLNVISIKLPALRERKEDIHMLVESIVGKVASRLGKKIDKIDHDFIECCMHYNWPGNIRELHNIIERAIILTKNGILSAVNFPANLLEQMGPDIHMQPNALINEDKTLKNSNRDAEKSIILRELQECRYNRSIAAERLGISRSTLYRKMKELGLN